MPHGRATTVPLSIWRGPLRDGAGEERDLDGTIRAAAEHGWLDVRQILADRIVPMSLDGIVRGIRELR